MSTATVVLSFCQFLFMSAAAISIAFSGLVGKELADDPAWATLPFLATTAVTAALTLLLPASIQRYHYKRVFRWGAATGIVGGILTATAIAVSSFPLFCFAAAWLGVYQATALYYRFAAADMTTGGAEGRAVAGVISGGIPAAFIGPMLGAEVIDILPVRYAGSYLVAAIMAFIALLVLTAQRLPSTHNTANTGAENSATFTQAVRDPNTIAAIGFCAGAYGVMMLIMLATPLYLSTSGHSDQQSASVIQWHLLGMFAPSLLTGRLIDRWQPIPVGFAGGLLVASSIIVALMGDTLAAVHGALLLLGVGWNLMYMTGTAILSRISHSGLRGKARGATEFVTFLIMMITAATAGWLYHHLGWHSLLWGALTGIVCVTFMGVAAPQYQRISARIALFKSGV